MIRREESFKFIESKVISYPNEGLLFLGDISDHLHSLFDHLEAELKAKDELLERMTLKRDIAIRKLKAKDEEIASRICENCKYYKDEVCCNDKCPLCADFVSEDFGCNKFEKKDK